MLYVLKRKDQIITLVDFLEDGSVYKFHQDLVHPELAPLHDVKNHDWLKQLFPITAGFRPYVERCKFV